MSCHEPEDNSSNSDFPSATGRIAVTVSRTVVTAVIVTVRQEVYGYDR